MSGTAKRRCSPTEDTPLLFLVQHQPGVLCSLRHAGTRRSEALGRGSRATLRWSIRRQQAMESSNGSFSPVIAPSAQPKSPPSQQPTAGVLPSLPVSSSISALLGKLVKDLQAPNSQTNSPVSLGFPIALSAADVWAPSNDISFNGIQSSQNICWVGVFF